MRSEISRHAEVSEKLKPVDMQIYVLGHMCQGRLHSRIVGVSEGCIVRIVAAVSAQTGQQVG